MRHPYRSAFLAFLCLFLESRGQQAFRINSLIDKEQFMLPWDGPGAAVFNPALIAETHTFDARFALFRTASRKSGAQVFQGTSRVYRFLYAGASYFSDGQAADGSSALYEESILVPMIACDLDSIAGSGLSLAMGAAMPRHGMNAFGAVKSSVTSVDLGLHARLPIVNGVPGQVHVGFTMRNLYAEKVELPSNMGKYDAFLINYDASIFWSSIYEVLDLYAEFNSHETQDASEGPSKDDISLLKSFGVEVRPVPMVGLKLERTWLGTWTSGVVLRAPVMDILAVGAEANLSHDMFFSKTDEGRGFLWTIALNVGM
jgi:hypothetical protein